jgi:DNA-binding Xre family transcriptional regulator
MPRRTRATSKPSGPRRPSRRCAEAVTFDLQTIPRPPNHSKSTVSASTLHPFALLTPPEIATELGRRLEVLRLSNDWRRETLAERAGVSTSTIQRFETHGRITLVNLLRLASALGRNEDLASLFRPPPASSIDELERLMAGPTRKRGRR